MADKTITVEEPTIEAPVEQPVIAPKRIVRGYDQTDGSFTP